MMKFLKRYKSSTRKIILLLINSLESLQVFKRVRFNKIYNRYKLDFEKTFELLFPQGSTFKFIQIGANDGVSFDNLSKKITERESKGILIEPSAKYFNELLSNYRNFSNLYFLNKAIHATDSKVTLYELNESGIAKLPDWGKGIGSISKDHLLKFKINSEDMNQYTVDAISFNAMIREFNDFKNIDYLQIDTEGYDGEIIKSIDFSAFSSKGIKYESASMNIVDIDFVNKLLVENRYYVFKTGTDTIAIRQGLPIRFL